MRTGAVAAKKPASKNKAENVLVTLTYSPEREPVSMRVAEANVQAFVRDVNQQRQNRGQPKTYYACVTRQSSTGKYYHNIVFGREADAVEAGCLWNLGKSRVVKPEEDTENITAYIYMDPSDKER